MSTKSSWMIQEDDKRHCTVHSSTHLLVRQLQLAQRLLDHHHKGAQLVAPHHQRLSRLFGGLGFAALADTAGGTCYVMLHDVMLF